MRSHWYYRVDPQYLAYLKSKEWLARRAQVIQRCNNTCERCGKFAVAEVHHLTYARIFHEELEDLQGLCEYCHAFLHRERPDDGTAEHERQVKQRAEFRQQVERARYELQRFDEKPDIYRSFIEEPFPSHRDLMGMLRQHPRVIIAGYERQIFDVKYAKRKYESAVAFKLKWDTAHGYAWSRVRSAEEWLHSGKVVFDTERQLWVDIGNIRLFVQRYSAAEQGAAADRAGITVFRDSSPS